jgi:hypothetical protein
MGGDAEDTPQRRRERMRSAFGSHERTLTDGTRTVNRPRFPAVEAAVATDYSPYP